mmetsp:Transcript_23694/g.60838  ORF Transcript_23694/g.60838 Transcript_23694/m.60838 type:complete len:476 (-) Transcript_23694:265-1692(-)
MAHIGTAKATAGKRGVSGNLYRKSASLRRSVAVRTQQTRKRVIRRGVFSGSREADAAEEHGVDEWDDGGLAEDWQDDYEIPGLVDFYPQEESTRAVLTHPNGSSAEIDLLGARVTSWKTSDGREMLHTANHPGSYGGIDKRDGITVAFPQFGQGQLPRDGFVSQMPWEVVGTEAGDEDVVFDPAPGICMQLTDTAESRAMWPHSFQMEYQVNLMENDDFPEAQWFEPEPEARVDDDDEVQRPKGPGRPKPKTAVLESKDDDEDEAGVHTSGAQQLRFLLQITNTGDEPIRFTTGIRPLLAVKNLGQYGRWVRVLGLGAKYYFDYSNSSSPKLRMLGEDFLTFGDNEVDSLYVDVFGNHDLMFCPGDRSYISLHNRKGFKDVAAWNPHEGMPQEYQDFVSLGSARVARVVTLSPGEKWFAESVLRAHDQYWDEMPEFQKNPQLLAGLDHPPAQASRFEEQSMEMEWADENADDMEI